MDNFEMMTKGSRFWALAILTGGLLFSYQLMQLQTDANSQRIHEAAAITVDQVMDDVSNRLNLYQYGLRGARGTVLVTAKEGISRQAFQHYHQSRDIGVEFPGARGFGIIRKVMPENIEAFLQEARNDDWPDFTIRELSPNRNERFIIQYIEPVARNRQAVGLDIGSEYNRRRAAQAAIDTGTVQLTGPITLVQASGKPLQSFLILMPIYHQSGGSLKSIAERRAQVYGWSYAPLVTEEVLGGIDIDSAQLQLRLSDVTDPGKVDFFYNTPAPEGEAELTTVTERNIFGRQWRFELGFYPAYAEQQHLDSPYMVFAFGVFVTLLLTLLVEAFVKLISRKKAGIIDRTMLVSMLNASTDALLTISFDGTVTRWSEGAKRLLGVSAEEAVGFSVDTLLVLNNKEERLKEMLAKAAYGVSPEPFDLQCRHRGGDIISCRAALIPVKLEGHFIGVSIVICKKT